MVRRNRIGWKTLGCLLVGASWASILRAQPNPAAPDPLQLLNEQLYQQQEAAIIQRILDLTDIDLVLSQRQLLPPTVVVQRDIIPAIPDPSRGRATKLQRGQSVALHDATFEGAVIPVEIRPAINSIPLQAQGRFDPLAIQKMARGLQPGFGGIPLNATDIVYQLREHLAQPSHVQLTEYAPAKLQREGIEVGDIELRKERELPLLEIQGNAVRLQVYNSEVEVPIDWTDYTERQTELNSLLDALRPIPTSSSAITVEAPMQKPPENEVGSVVRNKERYMEKQLSELQIKTLELDRSLKVRMLEDQQRIRKVRGELRLISLQKQNLIADEEAEQQSLLPGQQLPPQLARQKQYRLLEKRQLVALRNLVEAYQQAADTRIQARRGFEAQYFLAQAKKQIESQTESPEQAAAALELLAPMEEQANQYLAEFEGRKVELLTLARRDPILGQAAYDAVVRNFPDLPADRRRELEQQLAIADWERVRGDFLQQLTPILKLGTTEEKLALARLDQLKAELPRENRQHYQLMLREIQNARRTIRGYHVDKPILVDEEVPDQGLLKVFVMEEEPEEDTLWLRIALLGGLGLSVGMICIALAFVLRPKASEPEGRPVIPDVPRPDQPTVPPPPGQE